MVLCHVPRREVFHTIGIVLLGYHIGYLVQKVIPLIGRFVAIRIAALRISRFGVYEFSDCRTSSD